jgi:tRNA(fMet)-specific endonuclease VapC
MGLILDSSVVIAGERKGQTVVDVLTSIRTAFGPEDVALSTVSVIELEHGVWRAKDAAQADRRRRFFDDWFGAVAIYPLTFDIAPGCSGTRVRRHRAGRTRPHVRHYAGFRLF